MSDIFGSIGFIALMAGITVRYGWDVSLIIGGGTLLALAIIGAMRQ